MDGSAFEVADLAFLPNEIYVVMTLSVDAMFLEPIANVKGLAFLALEESKRSQNKEKGWIEDILLIGV